MKKAMITLAAIFLFSGCGSNFEWFPKGVTADKDVPVVSAFVFSTENGSLTARIDTLSASDNVGVTGYLVTESATTPVATDSGWSAAPPATHTLTAASVTTLYAWAKDAAGNISAARSATPAYTIQKALSFPAGVGWVADIAYHKASASFWLLAGTSGPPPNTLVKIDATSGQQLSKLDAVSWPFYIGEASYLAFDGNTFWISSSGYDNSGATPVLKSEIYRILNTGTYYATYNCPATLTGFCQGLTWDGANLWAAGSDNMDLVSFQEVSGVLTTTNTFKNLWGTNGVSDIGFDSAAGQLLVLKGGVIPVDRTSGTLLTGKGFTLPASGRGDWDGSLFWVVDNSSRKLLGLTIK